ncbi:LysE family transporter [Geomicrobium sp. JCM 19039]|uniref:LysE family transporter n=1 Tax=Geomicrobium sp. JCM 19039 TaxID=1460636 RepID=UPI00187C7B8E|nr:LysE family transporter [Geomicrobium sp. JCM 19039]
MLLIVTFIVFGFVVALPVGPVTIEMIRVSMRSGFLSAWMIGIGGMVIDVGMILLIYFGLSTVFELERSRLPCGL